MSAPRIDTEVRAVLDELTALRGELQDMLREQQADLAQERAVDAARQEELAERARAGELGRDWQTLQRRIDLGETTAAAVVRGEDDSAQAHEVRAQLHTTADAAEDWERLAEPDPGRLIALTETDPVTERADAAATAASLQAQLDRLRALRPSS